MFELEKQVRVTERETLQCVTVCDREVSLPRVSLRVRGCTQRAVLGLVGGAHHWQAGAGATAPGEGLGGLPSLRHGVQ